MQKVSECWLSPRVLSQQFPGTRLGTGQSLSEHLWVGLLAERCSQLPASLHSPPPGELCLVRSAACVITGGRKAVASSCHAVCHHGPCRQDTHPRARGFLKLQESLSPDRLPTQILPLQPNVHPQPPCTEEIQSQVGNHWTSCKGRVNQVTTHLPSSHVRLG